MLIRKPRTPVQWVKFTKKVKRKKARNQITCWCSGYHFPHRRGSFNSQTLIGCNWAKNKQQVT